MEGRLSLNNTFTGNDRTMAGEIMLCMNYIWAYNKYNFLIVSYVCTFT